MDDVSLSKFWLKLCHQIKCFFRSKQREKWICSLLCDVESELLVMLVSRKERSYYISGIQTDKESVSFSKDLCDCFGIKSSKSALLYLKSLMYKGLRFDCQLIPPAVLSEPNRQIRYEAIQAKQFKAEKFQELSDNLSDCMELLNTDYPIRLTDEHYLKGGIGWDMGQMILVSYIAFNQKYLKADEARRYITFACDELDATFADGKEVVTSYLIGKSMMYGYNEEFKHTLLWLSELVKEEM